MITFEQNSSCVCNIPLLTLTFRTHYSCMLCRATKSHKILKRNGKLGKSNTLLFVYWQQIYTYFWQVNINLMLQIQSMSQCVSKRWFSNVQDSVCITWRYSTIHVRDQRRPCVESWISSHKWVLHRLGFIIVHSGNPGSDPSDIGHFHHHSEWNTNMTILVADSLLNRLSAAALQVN